MTSEFREFCHDKELFRPWREDLVRVHHLLVEYVRCFKRWRVR
jgi:hypothetical protein